MADTNDMVNIAQSKLEQLICKYRAGVGEPKQGMVRKNRTQAHCPCMKNRLMAETTQAGVSMDDLDLFANDNIPEDRKERENRGHSRLAVYNEERDMVDLEAIGKVSDSGAAFVCMGDNDHFVASVNEFLGRISIM